MAISRRRRYPPPVRGPRMNHQIRIRQIRVIDNEGEQLGVLETADALALARERGFDLVEIAPDQRPPVCRIMDYGKFKYEQKKKDQASKRKQHQAKVKEVRVRPKIGEHDIQVKVRRARQFIEDGDKVQIHCLFRGREMAHKGVAQQVMMGLFEQIEDIAKIEVRPHMEGRRMVMLVSRK